MSPKPGCFALPDIFCVGVAEIEVINESLVHRVIWFFVRYLSMGPINFAFALHLTFSRWFTNLFG